MRSSYGNSRVVAEASVQSRTRSPSTSGLAFRVGNERILGADGGEPKMSSSPRIAPGPIETLMLPKLVAPATSIVSFSSAAPPPPRLHGCLANRSRSTSLTLTNEPSTPVRSTSPTISVQTSPFAGSSGGLGSPRIPITARTVSPSGFRPRIRRITVGVPCPGMYAPDVSRTCVRSHFGRNSSTSFDPNSRFMNEFETMAPIQAAVPRSSGPDCSQRSTSRSMNGQTSEYFPLHVMNLSRYSWLSPASFTVMYGGFATTT